MERRFALIKHTHFLSDLADFSVSSPADGDVLEYDSSTSKWVNVTVASLGGLAEAVQDLAGAALTDTTSVNFTYTDGTGRITADVLPAGVDHNSLLNYVADQHVAHSGVTMTAGAGLTGGGDISATRTFAVGAGTGITVNADAVALSAAAIASLARADSALQTGDNVSLLVNDAGYITSSSLPTGANPTASVGLSAVNGSATTFLRSDGAPALSQAIAPTWTGLHVWDGIAGKIRLGTSALQTTALIGARGSTDPNVLEWGHANPAGYVSTIGYLSNFGYPFIAFSGEGGSTMNTFTSRGISPKIFLGSIDATLSFGSVASANAANQTFVEAIRFNSATGAILAGGGSAASPSFSFINDTNTGGYLVGVDVLGWATGGYTSLQLSGGTASFSYLTITSPSGQQAALRLTQTSTADWINYIPSSSTSLVWYSGADRMLLSAAGELAIGAVGSASVPSISLLSDTNTGIYWPAADQLGFSEGGTGYMVGFREVPRVTSYTATRLGSVGRCMAISAGITINTGIYNAGDAFSVYNDSASAITLTQGASVTMRLGGTTTTGSRTLAARGVATLWFNSASEPIVSGPGVT